MKCPLDIPSLYYHDSRDIMPLSDITDVQPIYYMLYMLYLIHLHHCILSTEAASELDVIISICTHA